jgi:hypothetical protein
MTFMKPEINHGDYYEVEANHGETHIIPTDVENATTNGDLADYIEGTIDEPDAPVTIKTGWLARMSAPGYLDCTDWSAHATEQEAKDYLEEYYGDDDDA